MTTLTMIKWYLIASKIRMHLDAVILRLKLLFAVLNAIECGVKFKTLKFDILTKTITWLKKIFF